MDNLSFLAHDPICCYMKTSIILASFLLINSCTHRGARNPSSIENCDSSTISEFNIPEPSRWGIEGMTGKSVASNLIQNLLRTRPGCNSAKDLIKTTLQSEMATSWDDYVLLTILKNHYHELSSESDKLVALGFAADMFSGIRPGDHDRHMSSKFNSFATHNQMGIESMTMDARNVIIQLTLEQLKRVGVQGGYDGILNLSSSERSAIAQLIARKFTALFLDHKKPFGVSPFADKAYEFVVTCENKLTSVFGIAGKSAAVATGWDRKVNQKNLTIAPYIADRTSTVLRRFHTFSNMHVYRNLESSDSKELFYLPATCSTSGSGTGMSCRTYADGKCSEYKESYISSCSSLGRFKNVNIAAAHVSNQGRNVPRIKNQSGSVSVGFLAGAGGSGGLAPQESHTGYAHSHVQLTGKGFRLSFSDALCRTE